MFSIHVHAQLLKYIYKYTYNTCLHIQKCINIILDDLALYTSMLTTRTHILTWYAHRGKQIHNEQKKSTFPSTPLLIQNQLILSLPPPPPSHILPAPHDDISAGIYPEASLHGGMPPLAAHHSRNEKGTHIVPVRTASDSQVSDVRCGRRGRETEHVSDTKNVSDSRRNRGRTERNGGI